MHIARIRQIPDNLRLHAGLAVGFRLGHGWPVGQL
jgi:hypothetical protein